MKEACKKYNDVGFACLPVKQDKTPLVQAKWNDGFDPDFFEQAYGIGIICGKQSGGLECLDFDNHFGDARAILSEYMAIPEVAAIYQRHKLPIETSQRGGFHLLFRCTKNEGNRKLAQRLNDKGRPDAIIETRGEGGYFMCYPSPGYDVVKNDICHVATISEVERAILIDSAISFNEFKPVIRTDYESQDRPGDLYNADHDSIPEMKAILSASGWTHVDAYKWRRPGKREGISATLGKVAPNVFYCFTSNGYPFEPMRAYTPFQVLALLKFGGDFRAAAQSLSKGTREVVVMNKPKPESELDKILNSSRIDTANHIEKPPVILSIREEAGTSSVHRRVFTLGNFSCIIGKAKSKKTFLLSMFTAAMLGYRENKNIIGSLPENKNLILYFDTEQGEYDSYNVIRRIEKMAGHKDNMLSFNLRPYSPIERCQIIEYAFAKFGSRVGFCVIDGVADLANGINDEDEATRVTTFLLKHSKESNCHISTVIHQNKNDNYATGHLGSAVMKKAEILISVTKIKDDRSRSEVACEMSRGEDFEPFEMLINDEGVPRYDGAKKSRTQSTESVYKSNRKKQSDDDSLPVIEEKYPNKETLLD